MVDLQWLVGGEAGYGIMTTGIMMSKIFTRLGLSVFDYVEYPSLIRGGHNAYYVRASDAPLFSQKKTVDILVALNQETITKHKDELIENAAVIFDPNFTKAVPEDFSHPVRLYPVPFLDLTRQVGADRLMINTVSVGASLALFHKNYELLQGILQDAFGRKGEKVIGDNVNTSKAGYDYIVKNFGPSLVADIQKSEQKNLLIGGAEAAAFGAMKAGLKAAFIYPMTPINGIMATLTANALKYNIVVKEPEDEIAGINMAIGASFGGIRSMAATSGGGFSLMVEGLGLASQTETPLVIVMGMRPGPATGMPTWTEQGDLRFMLHSHQGDFPRIIVAPGDALEAYSQMMDAFNLADKYNLQVIVLVDKYLMEGHMTVDAKLMKAIGAKYKIQRGKMLSDEEAAKETDYKRFALTEDGISPRSIPGQKGGIGLAGSDEHDEKGLYNEESIVRIAMMDKRFRKLSTAIKNNEFPTPELYGADTADLTIVSWGSTKMTILEAMEWLKRDGINVNFVKVSYIHPFPTDGFLEKMQQTKKTLVIENNYSGQFEGIVREQTGYTFHNRLRKYDGRPFYPEEIIEKVKSLL